MLSELLSGNLDFTTAIIYIISSLVVIFLTLPVHEFAHGFIADKMGDPTPRYQGRLTLNPFAHIDYFGSLCVLAFGFGWAKPVQVNARNFKNPKVGMAFVAVAGPISNIIMSFLACIFSNIAFLIGVKAQLFAMGYVVAFFDIVAELNIYLAVFNLLPVPPLDGSRILGVLLPDRIYYKIMRYEQYIYIGLMLLLFAGALDGILYTLANTVYGFVYKIAAIPFDLLV